MTTIRLDRNAFRRGVNEVMTFAPLRDAVRSASDALFTSDSLEKRFSKAQQQQQKNAVRELRKNDGKPAGK